MIPTEFHRFPDLSGELRRMIWHTTFLDIFSQTPIGNSNIFIEFNINPSWLVEPTHLQYNFTLESESSTEHIPAEASTIAFANHEAQAELPLFIAEYEARWPAMLTDGRAARIPFDPNTDRIGMDILSLYTMYHYMFPRRSRHTEETFMGPQIRDRRMKGFELITMLGVSASPPLNNARSLQLRLNSELFRRLKKWFLTGLIPLNDIQLVPIHQDANVWQLAHLRNHIQQIIWDILRNDPRGVMNATNANQQAAYQPVRNSLNSLRDSLRVDPNNRDLFRVHNQQERDNFDAAEVIRRTVQDARVWRSRWAVETAEDIRIRQVWDTCQMSW